MAKGFALQVEKFAKKVQGNMDLVVRKVALDLLARVVRRTPVDTGRARGNWQLAVNTIPRTETGAGAGGRVAARSTVDQGTAEALKAKWGDRIYIVNGVPYIFQLERGSSTQAPTGMVAVTLQEYPGVVRREANETRRGR